MKINSKQKIKKTYKFRLYPTLEQEERIVLTLEQCRFIYNFMLNELQKQDIPNKYALQNLLPRLREQYLELKNVYSKALQYEVYRLFSNFKSLSQSKKNGKRIGKLRFKSKGSFKTVHYNQSGFKIISKGTRLDRLHISKIGDIPIRIHRNIDGKIKQVTIKKDNSGKWYACITVETGEIVVKQPIKNAVGLDMGIKHFLSDSDGRQIENSYHLKKTLKRLRQRQKRLSKSKIDSKNRSKQRIRVARLHEKITSQRKDFLHKLSRYYVNNYNLIVIENLNIKNMVRNHYFSQDISDVSWNRFAQMLSYKAESAGKIVVRVNPRNTSKIYKYGDNLDRDYNASLNILERGLQSLVGMGQTEFTPVDIRPLQKLYVVSASQVVESGSLLQNC